ncbi:MAG: hypothetical protein Q9216_002841 [Gyalolechia sp. 2 TL-2023]
MAPSSQDVLISSLLEWEAKGVPFNEFDWELAIWTRLYAEGLERGEMSFTASAVRCRTDNATKKLVEEVNEVYQSNKTVSSRASAKDRQSFRPIIDEIELVSSLMANLGKEVMVIERQTTQALQTLHPYLECFVDFTHNELPDLSESQKSSLLIFMDYMMRSTTKIEQLERQGRALTEVAERLSIMISALKTKLAATVPYNARNPPDELAAKTRRLGNVLDKLSVASKGLQSSLKRLGDKIETSRAMAFAGSCQLDNQALVEWVEELRFLKSEASESLAQVLTPPTLSDKWMFNADEEQRRMNA